MNRIISKFKNHIIKRCLLTQSYPSSNLWKERLENIPIDLTANDLAVQLQVKLSSDIPISALDFDILMNRVNEIDIRNIGFIIKIIKDFRKTQEALKVFESSSHGIIRNLIDIDEEYQASQLIRDREKTGVFLDEITVNLLLDKFLVQEHWENAFLTSAEWILQETLDTSKLAISMCLVSCLHFWQQSLWKWKPEMIDVSKLPMEDVFVRYLKPEFFDDHFDLCGDNFRRRLLGKCLYMLSNHLYMVTNDETDRLMYYKNNLALLGLALHEKLTDLIAFTEQLSQSDNIKLNSTVMDAVVELIGSAELTNNEIQTTHMTHSKQDISNTLLKFQNLVDQLRMKQQLLDEKEFIEDVIKYMVGKIELLCNGEEEAVKNKYATFASHRLDYLNKAKSKIAQQLVLENAKKKLLELTEQEETLRYFEKMPEIMYKSWLARRTREEKKYSSTKSNQQNLDNLKKKSKPQFIIQ